MSLTSCPICLTTIDSAESYCGDCKAIECVACGRPLGEHNRIWSPGMRDGRPTAYASSRNVCPSTTVFIMPEGAQERRREARASAKREKG